MNSGIRLEFPDGRADLTSLDQVNATLAPVHTRFWRQDLSNLSPDLKEFLADADPSPERVAEVKPQFLLSRERLLALIAATGREPHVPGGGELITVDETHGATYPQLYVARPGVDFSRFDRLHVNLAADGTPVDDVVQLLCGSGLAVHQRLPSGETVKVRLDCTSPELGWLLCVDCSIPFIGSFTGAAPGTKAVSQTIGPPRWRMEYLE